MVQIYNAPPTPGAPWAQALSQGLGGAVQGYMAMRAQQSLEDYRQGALQVAQQKNEIDQAESRAKMAMTWAGQAPNVRKGTLGLLANTLGIDMQGEKGDALKALAADDNGAQQIASTLSNPRIAGAFVPLWNAGRYAEAMRMIELNQNENQFLVDRGLQQQKLGIEQQRANTEQLDVTQRGAYQQGELGLGRDRLALAGQQKPTIFKQEVIGPDGSTTTRDIPMVYDPASNSYKMVQTPTELSGGGPGVMAGSAPAGVAGSGGPKVPGSEVTAFEDTIEAASNLKNNLARLENKVTTIAPVVRKVGGWFSPEMQADNQEVRTLVADSWERINKLNKNGVMNEGDLEQVKKMLPDPTDPSWNTWSVESVLAGIRSVSALVDQRVEAARRRAQAVGVTTQPSPSGPATGGTQPTYAKGAAPLKPGDPYIGPNGKWTIQQ